jgi:methionyl-tRNA formyltransferase
MISFTFFGSSQFSVYVLEALEKARLLPTVIVTMPDRQIGRNLKFTPNPVKKWALQNKEISLIETDHFDSNLIEALKQKKSDVSIIASYGKIIPDIIINIPPHKTLNVHPSLLPKYRGASPLQSAILDDAKKTGLTIMRINEKMDEGPILAQEEVHIAEWPPYNVFEKDMGEKGGQLLARILGDWIDGKIPEKEQDHSAASYTKKINKEDGLIDFNEIEKDPYFVFRKIQAYSEWPQVYFFIEHNGKKIRVKIKQASFQNRKLLIEKVVPEGGKEISYQDFERSYL